jgi:hypothetical protein
MNPFIERVEGERSVDCKNKFHVTCQERKVDRSSFLSSSNKWMMNSIKLKINLKENEGEINLEEKIFINSKIKWFFDGIHKVQFDDKDEILVSEDFAERSTEIKGKLYFENVEINCLAFIIKNNDFQKQELNKLEAKVKTLENQIYSLNNTKNTKSTKVDSSDISSMTIVSTTVTESSRLFTTTTASIETTTKTTEVFKTEITSTEPIVLAEISVTTTIYLTFIIILLIILIVMDVCCYKIRQKSPLSIFCYKFKPNQIERSDTKSDFLLKSELPQNI